MTIPKPTPGKNPSKKHFDIARPGKSAASPTSRPVIVSNRPILKDPMVTDSIPGSDMQFSSEPARRISIKPLAEKEEKAEDSKKADNAPEPKPASDSVVPPEPVQDVDAADNKEEATEPEEKKPAKKTDTDTDLEKAEPQEDSKEEVSAEPESKDEDEQSDETGEDTEETNETDARTQGDQTSEEEEAELAAHKAEIEKLIVSREYFLPINSVSKRRTKHHVILGVLLIILLALAWTDIALDAGLIQINNIKPVTHFFSN